LVEGDNFYFLEVNARLQVEHPVTEMRFGCDLVCEQLRIASGGKVSDPAVPRGAAIECRINAEHPSTFQHSPGRITYFHPPGGLGVRVDSAAYQGYVIPPFYDSLVGKLIVHGRTRTEALLRLRRALDEFVIEGVETTLPLFRALVRNPDVQNGQYDIHWLEDFLKREAKAEG
jgi:acetyl-CoA carboxylase biotin carboxylase subunit